MRAAIVERYGPPEVVRIAEVPKPVPGEHEILVRVSASTVNSGDARVRGLRIPGGMGFVMRLVSGFNGPRQPILGFDAAGVVEAVGSGVTAFRPGDRVAGSRGFRFGMHAEYVLFTEADALARIPDALSEEEAVAVMFGGSTALLFLREGRLAAGESILVNGASGAVGVMAVQIAKRLGAVVTAVCSARNDDLVRALGADHVIAYDRQDFATAGQLYDVVMDNHGNATFKRVKALLRPGGRFLQVIFNDLFEMISGKFNATVIAVDESKTPITGALYAELFDMAVRGDIRPVIERVYALDEIVDAYRRVDSGHKVGSLVLRIGG